MFNIDKIQELLSLKDKQNGELKTTQILNILGNEITSLYKNKVKIPKIIENLQETLDVKISYAYVRSWLAEQNKNNKSKQKIIALVNFKGGVGKSTIGNILNLPNKIIINLDISQNAEEINVEETINFYELHEEYGLEIEEVIEGAFEDGKEYVILDTPGEINEEYLKIIDKIDHFIVPFTAGKRSINTTINTIESLLSILKNKNATWCLILNKYDDEIQAEKEIEIISKSAKELLGKNLKCISKLKFSRVVSTIERDKKNIDNLMLKNRIAYRTFEKRIKEINKDIQENLLKD